MSRTSWIISIILAAGATSAPAETFNPSPYVKDAGIDVLNRQVANEQFGKNLFGDPYATVVVGTVDVYDRFPYLEARYFQIVSDPAWNRLLMGEVGRGLLAYDGAGSSFGRLASPRGLAADGNGRVYLADGGNDRVLVFETVSEYDRIELKPVYAIDGLHDPHAVAFSDGGTAFDTGDDALYVANTGRNEVRRYTLGRTGATFTHAIGELGGGDGRFAGPTAIAAGRTAGVNDADVYVADTHNGRIVRLRDDGGTLAWVDTEVHRMGVITSLDTDHHGNLYAAAPHAGRVGKFTSSLHAVANLSLGVDRPRSFHAVFATVTDHRTGTRTRSGQGSGIVVDEWGGESGLRLLSLGVELKDVRAVDGRLAATVTLTDHAALTAEIVDPASGRVVARREAGVLPAGSQTVSFGDADFIAGWNAGAHHMVLRAHSTYDGSTMAEASVPVTIERSGTPALAGRLVLIGNTPNPFNPETTIRFSVPAGTQRAYSLRVYDVRGKLVRVLGDGRIAAGWHDVRWDGRDERGRAVSSGIYLYRLQAGTESLTGKMALLK